MTQTTTSRKHLGKKVDGSAGALFRIALVVAQPLLWWYCVHELSLVNRFWRDGVAEHATVIALDHVSGSWLTDGADYYYRVNVPGLDVADTRVLVPVGHELSLPAGIDVLVLPGKPPVVMAGTKGSDRFDTAVSLIADGDWRLLVGGSLILMAGMLGALLFVVASLI